MRECRGDQSLAKCVSPDYAGIFDGHNWDTEPDCVADLEHDIEIQGRDIGYHGMR